jgi:rhamnogalacturonyl hydrolase YesR
MVSALLAAALLAPQSTAISDRLGSWGVETIEMIREQYHLPDTLLYADKLTVGRKPTQPAFNWGAGVQLSALAAAARWDSRYSPWLREYADATRVYWNPAPPVAGYDVLPMPKPVDRYYDDNAWMAMALVEAYEVLGDDKYLRWAEDTMRYVLSGEDALLGGGIYWRESDKATKNTCSNAPSVAAALSIYRHTRDQRLLVAAIRLYGWTKRTLQDPEDHLMWDNIDLAGKIERTKWSYNTGLMIRSAAELFAATRNPQYMDDLRQFQSASGRRWLRDESIRDDGRFAHLLMESWIKQRERAPVPNPDQPRDDVRAFLEPLTTLRNVVRNESGLYGESFYRVPRPGQREFELLDQASAARAYFMAALYFRELERKAG